MPAATSIAIAGIALAAVGTGITVIQSQKAAAAQRSQAKAARRLAALQAQRERRKTIREGRIARGAALNQAAAVGAGESSGLRGGLSGISSQVGANLGFSTQTEGIQTRISRLGDKASRAQSIGAIGQGISSIGSSIFSNAAAIGGVFSRPSADPRFSPIPIARPF